ncbi:zinc finger and SCAN domain containing protein 4F-like [Nasonia vitripennis]|uniref:Uncharacterized protein n=1 Tax=Nasonia vitripennis TaxID=7425 RepID=A0A7M7TAK1_NASVI|nr:zinc finger and SCAN domain containing protein 4F-like [Nasonia vitripennis]
MSSDNSDCKMKTNEKASSNPYMYYCRECHSSYKRYHGYSISNCPNCKTKLIYRCAKCISLRQSKRSIKRHIFYCLQSSINKREEDSEIESENSDSSSHSAKIRTYIRRSSEKFSTKNLVILFCPSCEKSTPKIYGVKTNECKNCREVLSYVCKKCNNRYKSHNALTTHLKNYCNGVSE